MTTLLLYTLAAAAATHSADTAVALDQVHAAAGAPILIGLEGDPTSAAWGRLEGWLSTPTEQILLFSGADAADSLQEALDARGLPCGVHLRQTAQGWEAALYGDCGQATLPEAMAITAAPSLSRSAAEGVTMNSTSVWGLLAERRHGFRVGYAYTQDERHFTSPHLLVMGYEIEQEIPGGEALDVLMIGNLSASGLNQSKLLPTLNLLLGVEINDMLQLGIGPSVSWATSESEMLHMIAAVGWTTPAGDLEVPVHAAWIPDINERDRFIVTTGVTF